LPALRGEVRRLVEGVAHPSDEPEYGKA